MSLSREHYTKTWDKLVAGERQRRNALADIDDVRRPREKSPVHVTLIWDGDDPVEPGHTVKLGAVAFDPDDYDSAPFSGLVFHATAYVGSDGGAPYAITLGPSEGGGEGVGEGFIPEATWAKSNIVDDTHTTATWPTTGTLLTSALAGSIPIIWKPTGTGEKWCVIPLGTPGPSGTSEPPLRAFQLTANKTLASATATAKWLDLDGNLIGSDVTLYDPEQRFSGRVANDLYSGSLGFRGYALLRTDLAATDPDRWEIIEMDSVYQFIKAEFVYVSNYPSTGNTLECRYQQEIDKIGYDRHPPAASNGLVGYQPDSTIFNHASYLDPVDDSAPGDTVIPVRVLMQLTDPDADPPKYRVYEVSSSNSTPATLSNIAAVVKLTGTLPEGSDAAPGETTGFVAYSISPPDGYVEHDDDWLEAQFGVAPWGQSVLYNPLTYEINTRNTDSTAMFAAALIGVHFESSLWIASYQLCSNNMLTFAGAANVGSILHVSDDDVVSYDSEECEE